MSDTTQLNTNSTAGDIISTDELLTLNGGAPTAGEKVQRVKVGYGVDGDLRDVSSTYPMPVTSIGSSSASMIAIAASGSSQTALASSASRKGAQFYLDTASSASCLLKFGATASASDFTVRIEAGGSYTLPGPNVYTGQIDVIWESVVAGTLRGSSW